MARFTDIIQIKVRAGHGGAGSTSLHREKYRAKGGPDGGDGGKGGDLLFSADRRYYNLSHLNKDRQYSAEVGQPGMSRDRHGRDGSDFTIMVPPGTEIRDSETDELLSDLVDEGTPFCAVNGGIGGKGNTFYKSATNQTPRYAQSGLPGEERTLTLSLKLIADVGLVGLPNAGKSTLLSKLTNARPKIGNYPFTTLIPNLGVVERIDGSSYRIADIPGIIEGAHQGLGLGLSFLRHIERVGVILYVIDVTEEDPLYNRKLLEDELASYSSALTKKPFCILLNKIDCVDVEKVDSVIHDFKGERVLPVSALAGENIEELLRVIDDLLEYNGAA